MDLMSDKIRDKIKLIEKYYETQKTIIQTFADVGDYYREIGDDENAIKYYGYFIHSNSEYNELSDDALYWLINYYFNKNDEKYFYVLDCLTYNSVNRNIKECYYFRGMLYTMNNNITRSLNFLKKGVEKNCYKSMINFLNYTDHLELKFYGNIVEKLLSLYSDRIECLETVALYYCNINNYDLGLKYSIEAEKKGSKKVYYCLGVCSMMLSPDKKLNDIAEKYFLLGIENDDIKSMNYFGQLLYNIDRKEEGLKYLKHSITNGSILQLEFYLDNGGILDGETFLMLMDKTISKYNACKILKKYEYLVPIIKTYTAMNNIVM